MTITYRRATLDDTYAVFNIFLASLLDLSERIGAIGISGGSDPAVVASLWEKRRPLFEHLSRTADQDWLAEQDGVAMGYARSIVRDDVRELTEFFILPGYQSAGVGRELLARAFPVTGASRRLIVATIDTRAVVRYLKANVYPRFPGCYFSRSPESVPLDTDLVIEPITASPETLDILGMLDKEVLSFRRDVDHTWLLSVRQAVLYRRGGQPVGYGYLGTSMGPFALLDDRDFPAVLAHAERSAYAGGYEFGVEVPLINRAAVDYLLARGCQIDGFLAFVMTETPFGKFENYVFTSPPLFL